MVPAHRPRRQDGDHGNLQTLEVVIVIMLMTSAVVFVATFEAPPRGSAPSRSILQQQAEDALAILYDTPVGDQTALSAYILDCLQGSCRNLERKLDKLLPDGANYAVYMSNGGSLFTVYERRPPGGEAVSARRFLEPSWSHTFIDTAVDHVNPNEDALVVYAVPIFKSNPLTQGGSPLLVRVEGVRTSDNASYVLTAATSTRAYNASDTDAAAVSLYFHESGNPLASDDVTDTTLLGGLTPSLSNVTFRLRVKESGGGSVPADTALTVRIPVGWTASATAGANPGWTVSTDAAADYNASYTGSELRARLNDSLSSGEIDFTFNAIYKGHSVDYYPFQASLSAGALSSAALLVRADSHGTQPSLEIPQLVASVPNPMGSNDQTTWTLSALVPEGTGSWNDALQVTRIEIREGDGRPIFDDVDGISDAGGSWQSQGDRIVWTGSRNVKHDSPLNLTFRVTASGYEGGSDARPAYTPPATFGAWAGRIDQEVAPGLFRGSFLPSTSTYRGYNGSAGSWLYGNHTVASDGVYRTTSLPGDTNYSSGPFTLMRDSLYGSTIDIDARKVPVGGAAGLSVDVQSTLYALAELGMSPNVTLRIHPPWAQNSSMPVYEEVLFDATTIGGTLLDEIDSTGDGRPEASSYGRFNATPSIPPSWLFGTYVVEVELDWSESVLGTLGGLPVSETLVRSARIYDYFIVTPPDGLSPVSPIYDVHLVAWFDDWR